MTRRFGIVRAPRLLALLLITACLRTAVLHIVPGSTRQRLSFRLSRNENADVQLDRYSGIRVVKYRCGVERGPEDSIYWRTYSQDGKGVSPAPLNIHYGVPLPAFTTDVEARPLSGGCFEAELLTPGWSAATRFEVDTLGIVRELPQGGQ
jgi:hypothetical protein